MHLWSFFGGTFISGINRYTCSILILVFRRVTTPRRSHRARRFTETGRRGAFQRISIRAADFNKPRRACELFARRCAILAVGHGDFKYLLRTALSLSVCVRTHARTCELRARRRKFIAQGGKPESRLRAESKIAWPDRKNRTRCCIMSRLAANKDAPNKFRSRNVIPAGLLRECTREDGPHAQFLDNGNASRVKRACCVHFDMLTCYDDARGCLTAFKTLVEKYTSWSKIFRVTLIARWQYKIKSYSKQNPWRHSLV